jgi:hypothetical protein
VSWRNRQATKAMASTIAMAIKNTILLTKLKPSTAAIRNPLRARNSA